MAPSDDKIDCGPRLAHPNPGVIRLRRTDGFPKKVLAGLRDRRWQMGEVKLARPSHRRFIVYDNEVIGTLCTTHKNLGAPFCLSDGIEHLGSAGLLARMEPAADADWLIKTGLWLDPRRSGRLGPQALERLLHRTGPLAGAVQAARFGLKGYLAAVVLCRADDFRPALSTAAYVQQVKAGAIDEPLLKAHLRYGARPVAVVDDATVPLCVVRWQP